MKRPRVDGIIAIFLIFLMFGFNYFYQHDEEDGLQMDSAMVADYLKEVTSQAYGGHIAGSIDNKKLGTYIEDTLMRNGYEDAYYTVQQESFKLLSITPDKTPVLKMGTVADPVVYENFKDYRIIRNPYSGNISYEDDLVFIKGSITSVDKEIVEGKVIITDLYANQKQSIDIAREKGIRGIIYATKNRYVNIEDRQLSIGDKESNDLFMMNISYEQFVQLEKLSKEHGSKIPYGFIKLEDDYAVGEGQNIVATVVGKDPLKEIVFVTHYDGKGRVGEDYYPGASRNGTAIALMMDLARSIKATGVQPDYTIRFVFLDGQELGNKGAKAFLDQHFDPAKSQEFIAVNDIGTSNTEDLYLNAGSTVVIPTPEANMLRTKVAMLGGDAGIKTKRFELSFSSEGMFAGSTAEYLAFEGLPVVELKNLDTTRGVPFIYTTADTEEPVDMDKVMAVGTLMSHYVYYEGFQSFNLSYLTTTEWLVANLLILILLVMTMITWFYRRFPELKIGERSIRDFYLSVPYSVFTKLMNVVIPTLLMLVIMVGLLSIPHFTSSSNYGSGIDNYIPHLHVKHTVLYSRSLLSGDLGAMNPTIVDAMIKGAGNSFRLLSVSLILALATGIGFGLWNGLKRSQIRTFMGLLIFSIPDVIISLGALYSIVYWFKDIFISPEALRTVVMPTFAMIIVPAIYIARIIEVAVIEEREQAYIYGAMARGASRQVIVTRHIMPKVLSKLFDTMGTVIRIAIINLIVVEYIFSSVGIGNYLMSNYHDAFFVIYISFGFGVMYFLLSQFFKIVSWRLNPMKRRV